jgi:hypothetical protein
MNRNISRAIQQVVIAAALVTPFAANAESSFQTGGGLLTATANVDFTITIPKVLFLQVGTGTIYANNNAVNLITFTVPAANVGNGTAVAATAGSGDLGNGTVTAMVRGNAGNVTLGATTLGAIGNGSGDSIDWSQITTTPAALTTGTVLAAPILANGSSTTVGLTAVNKVVNQDARWTYSYANSAVVAAGIYGGVNTNNGRVLYTASLP